MDKNNAIVSPVALSNLKDELMRLSKTIDEISELMNTDVRQLGHAWQDKQYQEFMQGYKHHIQKCKEISIRYRAWCTNIIEPLINKSIDIKRSQVVVTPSGQKVGGDTYSINPGGDDFESTYSKLSPDQKRAYNSLREGIINKEEDDLLKADFNINLGKRADWEPPSERTLWEDISTSIGETQQQSAKKRAQEALHDLEELAKEGARNNISN